MIPGFLLRILSFPDLVAYTSPNFIYCASLKFICMVKICIFFLVMEKSLQVLIKFIKIGIDILLVSILLYTERHYEGRYSEILFIITATNYHWKRL